MAAMVGRAWGWVRSWGGAATPKGEKVTAAEAPPSRGRGPGGWTWWLWGGWRGEQKVPVVVEEFWEAQEKLPPPVDTEEVGAGREDETDAKQEAAPRWWSRLLRPTSFLPWPSRGARPRGSGTREPDMDGDFSDYGTPPPSPPPSPSQLASPFRLFVHSCRVDVLPEHYDICFNFLRHLFDLLVVGFLWTVSPPAKLVLEVLGVQGALRLWFHGMAMFLVSTVGMAGLLWLVQEYLPEFALVYGIVQAAVISVSIRQSVIFGLDGDERGEEGGAEDEDKKEQEEAKGGEQREEKKQS